MPRKGPVTKKPVVVDPVYGSPVVTTLVNKILLDGKKSDFSDEDRARLHTIVNLLAEWNLLGLVDPDKSKDPVAPLSQIKILSHKEKNDWILVTKYNIGKKRRED